MEISTAGRQTRLPWILVGTLAALCAILGFVQYRWIEEVSEAHRERMRNDMSARLLRLRQEFNESVRGVAALQPRPSRNAGDEAEESEAGYLRRWRRWRDESPHAGLVKRFGLAIPRDGAVSLRLFDQNTGEFRDADWPAEWTGAHERFLARVQRSGPPPNLEEDAPLIEFPRFGGIGHGPPMPPGGAARQGFPPMPLPRIAEMEWLIVELDTQYLGRQLLPALLKKHLNYDGTRPFQALAVLRSNPGAAIYSTAADGDLSLRDTASGSIPIFENYRMPERGFGPGPKPAIGPPSSSSSNPPPLQGRWMLYVRDEAGSLDTLVQRARWRNYAVSGALFALLLATAWVLIRFTRKAQQLAELQMNFVAGVSHELRTPLAVIATAAYNLRGKLSQNPAQVTRYGSLIETEAQRLSAMVEQILQFAALRSGRGVQRREPVLLEEIIETGLKSNKELAASSCEVETHIEPRLPVVLGDPVALRHALQNLFSNAAKYGVEGGNWVGVTASSAETEAGAFVEIRVADRGPGIPIEEQPHIFEPFFRGRYAVQDQIHGTGLGLDLAKRIVEAHGGTIRVESAPMQGAEFVVRIPAAPAEFQDEFAHTAG